ncbi:hypothetical protein MLQ97_24645, partial [Escherichia coli]|nr:hypothetical protein [Escherichia coli]
MFNGAGIYASGP